MLRIAWLPPAACCLLVLLAGCKPQPTIPFKPVGPIQAAVGLADTYRTSAWEAGHQIRYLFDFGDSRDST